MIVSGENTRWSNGTKQKLSDGINWRRSRGLTCRSFLAPCVLLCVCTLCVVARCVCVAVDDFKGNKHQLPLARIKKIMKSDEDVRMISAEAPILFAKACELFILDLTLRAWAYTEHAPSKRRTLQRNDIAAAIQNAEIFDFLQEIVPVQPQDPSEEGTPPHRSPESTRSRRIHGSTPDVLLERPLLDPYGDALPVPVHQHLAHRASRQHSAAAAANAAAAAQAAQDAAAHASQYAAYASRGGGGGAHLYSGLTPEGLLANTATPGYSSSDPTASSYGMTSMSRGSSLDLMGAGAGVGIGVGATPGAISTPHFGGGSMALDQLPDVPPDTPSASMGTVAGSTLTPLPPARRPFPTGLSGSIHSPAISSNNLTPPTMLSPQHSSGMPTPHPQAAAQMQMQYHAQQQMMQQHTPQQQTPPLHTLPPTPSAAFFPNAGLPLHMPNNQAYLHMQQQQQQQYHQQQQALNHWLDPSNGVGGGGVVPPSPAAVPSVSTPSSSTNTLSTPNMFSSSGYSGEGSIDDDEL